jgi:UDP-N-acetyl-D-glucosamine dehydrogenase
MDGEHVNPIHKKEIEYMSVNQHDLLSMSSSYKKYLYHKIVHKTARIGVIGLGYVGLPTAFEKAEEGYGVIGFDVSDLKVKQVNNGANYINDIDDTKFNELTKVRKKLSATSDFSQLSQVDIVLICVPTPIDEYKQPDLSFVRSAAESIADHLHPGMLVILESTTYPGTTEEIMLPLFEEKGYMAGEDIFVAYSPERIDPGNRQFGIKNTPKIVGGVTEDCTSLAAEFIGEVSYPVSSVKVAEMAKVYENTFRFINIAFANEMAVLGEKMDIDIWEVIEASGTKPYGFMKFFPGPGVGGHCIPVDPYYLTYKAKELNQNTKLIEIAGEINNRMSEVVINRAMKSLNEHGKAINGSKVVVLGVAYKKDISDMRESPILPILDELTKVNADVTVCDPFVDQVPVNNEIRSTEKYSKQILQDADLVIIGTDHTCFDYEKILKESKIVLDTRNACKEIGDQYPNYIRL